MPDIPLRSIRRNKYQPIPDPDTEAGGTNMNSARAAATRATVASTSRRGMFGKRVERYVDDPEADEEAGLLAEEEREQIPEPEPEPTSSVRFLIHSQVDSLIFAIGSQSHWKETER
jgi:hypothetical protein